MDAEGTRTFLPHRHAPVLKRTTKEQRPCWPGLLPFPSVAAEQGKRRTKQSQMLDDNEQENACDNSHRQRHVRRRVVEDEAVPGDEHEHEHRQYPQSPVCALVSGQCGH